MTFRDIKYQRPDHEAYKNRVSERVSKMKIVKDGSEAIALMEEQNADYAHLNSMYQVAYIRNSVDTTDEFYRQEMAFFDETLPMLALANSAFDRAVLGSPYIDAIEAHFGEIYIRRMREQLRLVDPANVENQIEENRLVTEYFQIAGNCTTEFRGEKMNFYGLLSQMESPDRQTRKEAMTAWSALYASVAEQIDEIYDRMIRVRCRIADVLGLKDYTEYRYLQMERFSYGREEVAAYRQKIKDSVVPLVAKIYQERQRKLGLDVLHYYDEGITDPLGNVKPEGSAEELVRAAQDMYREMSPQTGEFFDEMVKLDMFDLVSTPTKQQGGYCTFVPDLDMPFIFSNFNGTCADIDVLTHEAGHSFEAYMAWRNHVPLALLFSTSEVAEIHSMSMEFFAYPWADRFFGGDAKKADRYRYVHLQDALTVIPYMACVDEFQHEVYANRMTDAEERYALWHRLEREYMPWRDYDGDEFLKKGGFWLQKQHIFMCPFYYIDYSLAQMGAFEFYLKDREDHEKAWAEYVNLCRAGGNYGYLDLLKLGGLSNPFDEDTIPGLMAKLTPLILEDPKGTVDDGRNAVRSDRTTKGESERTGS